MPPLNLDLFFWPFSTLHSDRLDSIDHHHRQGKCCGRRRVHTNTQFCPQTLVIAVPDTVEADAMVAWWRQGEWQGGPNLLRKLECLGISVMVLRQPTVLILHTGLEAAAAAATTSKLKSTS